MLHTNEVEGLSLGNIHPNLNQQFAETMSQVIEAFVDESSRYAPDVREAKITVEIKLRHRLETRSTEVSAKLVAKLPGNRSVEQIVRLPRGGTRFLVEVDDSEQLDMYREPEEGEGVTQ